MFLRRHRRISDGESYEYWSLVKTVRTARGPRHQIVARLGKLDGSEVTAARAAGGIWTHCWKAARAPSSSS